MKLTIKLLLGATLVAGLSVSAFAVCASDVDFGGTKKIIGLADGGAPGEAVNYGQTMQIIVADIPENNDSRLRTLNHDSNYNVEARKVGSMVCVYGLIQNSTDVDITTNTVFGTIPTGYRPTRILHINHYNKNSTYEGFRITPNDGVLLVYATAGEPFLAGTWKSISSCYITQ